MNILVVCQHFYPEEFRINDICFELVKKGHKVTVLTGLPNYPNGKVLKDYKMFKNRKQKVNGINIQRSFLIGRGTGLLMMAINYACFAVMASIKALFMKKDFDVIYVYQLSPITMAWPGILMKKVTKKPLVIHCLDQWPISVTIGPISKTGSLYRILTGISKWTYKKADLITISSKAFKDYFEDVLNIKDKQFIYLPSYAESYYKEVEFINNNSFDLVFAGNIGPAQSVETIVECANLLKGHKEIKFHIVGDGLSKEICENKVKEYQLDNIKFHGFHTVDKMPEFYAIADAFLITMADNEVVNNTLPAKIQSYMLAGRPIFGAINGEVRNVVLDAECGCCCESLNYEGLAAIILNNYKNQSLLNQWGKNGQKYYEDHFEKDRCIQDLEDVLKKVQGDK